MDEQELKEEMLSWSKVKLRNEAWFQCERAERAEERIKALEKELEQQRFNNKHNLSIDQKVADKIKELESDSDKWFGKFIQAEKKLRVAVKALNILNDFDHDGFVENFAFARYIARNALKEISGEQGEKE